MQAQKHVYQTQLQRCQDQIYDLITNRHVPRASDPGKFNIAVIIEKTPPLKKMSFMSIPIISQEYDSMIPETVLYLKKPMV